jgi:hypothetical protein
MALRFKAHWFVVASCFVIFHADLADAQTKPKGAGKPAASAKASAPPAKAGAPAAKAGAAPAKAPEPPKLLPANAQTMAPQEVFVCARPPGVHSDQYEWGFDKKDQLLTGTNVEKAVKQAGTRYVYIYRPDAPKENGYRMPYPHNNARCSGDTRPEFPKPGQEASTAPAPKPVIGIAQLLSSGSSGSGALPPMVQDFCNLAPSFQGSNSQHGDLARKFAVRLSKAIKENKAIGYVAPNELSVEAASELYSHFKHYITAAMAYRQVIAPKNVQQKFMEFLGGNNIGRWKRFVLVKDQWVTGATSTLPTVILERGDHDKVIASLDAQLVNVTTKDQAKDAYQKAYAGIPSWLAAIVPYFEN